MRFADQRDLLAWDADCQDRPGDVRDADAPLATGPVFRRGHRHHWVQALPAHLDLQGGAPCLLMSGRGVAQGARRATRRATRRFSWRICIITTSPSSSCMHTCMHACTYHACMHGHCLFECSACSVGAVRCDESEASCALLLDCLRSPANTMRRCMLGGAACCLLLSSRGGIAGLAARRHFHRAYPFHSRTRLTRQAHGAVAEQASIVGGVSGEVG
jgi:hypothetical protein